MLDAIGFFNFGDYMGFCKAGHGYVIIMEICELSLVGDVISVYVYAG